MSQFFAKKIANSLSSSGNLGQVGQHNGPAILATFQFVWVYILENVPPIAKQETELRLIERDKKV